MKTLNTIVLAGGVVLLSPAFAQTEDGMANVEPQDMSDTGVAPGEVTEEETLVLGSRRLGDYTYITEDTQKLVETAGAQGDPLAAVFSLPGVVYSAGEGSEPAVRGSSPSDNQYIVDFMPASYIFHEFGVSIFSEYILHDFQMYSAGVGPEYGNVTGAVFDVALREPENKPLSGVLDASMLRSGLFLEGGVTDNSAFYLSYRKSLIHLFIDEDAASDEDEGIIVQETPEDFDYQFKYMWRPSDSHRISISANGAGDDAAAEFTQESELARSNPDFAGDASLNERYRGQNLLWEFDGKSGHEFKLGFGVLNDSSDLNWGEENYVFDQESKQKTLKGRYSMPFGDQFRVAVGAEQREIDYDYYLFLPLFVCTEFDPDCEARRRGQLDVRDGIDWNEQLAYLNTTWQPTQKLQLDLGAHVQKNSFTDEQFTHPRFAAAYSITEKTTLTAKAGRYNQLPDLGFVLEESGNPNLRSPQSNHYVLGVLQQFENDWSVSVETYFKTFEDLPLALGENEPDGDLLYVNGTEGEAYGVDIMVNKNITDRWYGWMSLSYGKSERTNTRTSQTAEYYLDTPLIFNLVMNWQARHNLNFGWRWSIRSGQAYTPIIGVQENPFFEDSVLPVYGEEFSDRLPLYNRLDFRVKWDSTLFGKDTALIVDILNATNNQNVSERALDYDEDLQAGDEPETEDIVGIGLQPAITYRVYF